MFLSSLYSTKKLRILKEFRYNHAVKKTPRAAAIGLMVFTVSALTALWNPFQAVQWKLSDLLFSPKPPSSEITIVAIDDKSLSPELGLGRYSDWPRSYYAQLLRTIAPHNPAVLAYDLDFRDSARGMSVLRLKQLLRDFELKSGGNLSTPYHWYELLKLFESDEPVKDEAGSVVLKHPDDVDFEKAMSENGSVVLSSALVFSEDITAFDGELPPHDGEIAPLYSGEKVTVGYRNVLRDRDGVLRRFTPRLEGSEVSFPYAIVEAYRKTLDPYENGSITTPPPPDTARSILFPPLPDAGNSVLIAYTSLPYSYRMISFADILAGKFDPTDISGKIVLVGATARALQDLHATPTSRDPMPGVEVIANMVTQLHEGKTLAEQGTMSLLFVLLLIACAGSLLLFMLPLRSVAVVVTLVALIFPFTAAALYSQGFILNIVYPEMTWILTTIGVLWYRNVTEFQEKKRIKQAFSHYVSPVVVGELIKHPETLGLFGKRQQISVLFSDIVGFTTLSEKLAPEDTVALLNDYLTSMTEVIFEYHGTLDKYQGDAIMALFGAPLPDPHFAVNACASALNMRKALVSLHEKWNALADLPFKEELTGLDFRVGIATGPAVIGNVGSEKRFDYTAIGDVVNLGSRLESINRKYGTRIIVDKNTFVTITENHNPFVFRKLDEVRVKGKTQVTEIFEVLTYAENMTSDLKQALDDFENGRLLYTQRNFIDAKQYFEAVLAKLPNDAPSQIYRNRCNFYLRKPPGREWSPVVDLLEK